MLLPRRNFGRTGLARPEHQGPDHRQADEEAAHAGTLRQTGCYMQTIELTVDSSRERIVDLTTELERFCADLGDGLVNVFVPHATAGVALMETGSL